ncbi:MAG: SulP family inorganic anion transporter [Candidatus Magnetoovum sp. WYHC-5]|nr:SulP family inorganic anion transporter [Candidatus Magnetoovum sp. WYHC-5]
MGNDIVALGVKSHASFSAKKWLNLLFPFMLWIPEAKKTWKHDLFAGLTGAIVVLPQGVAFAMIAGLPPQYGLYTAIVPAIIAALFGSSRHLISGPTTAISLVIFSSIGGLVQPGSDEYISLVLLLTLLVGVLQFSMGAARMGGLINFVSHSVVIGFTAGAAVLIAVSQLKHFLGLDFKNASHFIDNIILLIKHIPELNPYVLIVSSATLFVVILVRKIKPTWPNMLFGMLTGAVLTVLTGWQNEGVKVIGALPSPIPPLSLPAFSLESVKLLTTPALAIAMMGLMEAVSIARSVALQSGQRIDGNQEFIGQGLSNIIGAFFSSYASSGSFTRTGVNYRSGAKTQAAAIFASIWLFLILFFISPYAAYLPIASMAAVILVVAYNLVSFHHIAAIFKISSTEAFILVVTFLATLFLELEFAIYVGALLSVGIYLNKTSNPNVLPRIPEGPSRHFVTANSANQLCPQFGIVRVDGDLYFAAMTYVEEQIAMLNSLIPTQKKLLLVFSSVNHIDVTGVESLKHLIEDWRKAGGDVYFYGIKWKLMTILYKSGVAHLVGSDHIFRDKETAVDTIVKELDVKVCAMCEKRVFWECDANKARAKEKK